MAAASDDDDVVGRLRIVPAQRLEAADELVPFVHPRRPVSSSA